MIYSMSIDYRRKNTFPIWILDSYTSHYVSPNFYCFPSMSHSFSIPIMTTDGTPIPLANVGSVVTHNLFLSNVYHILKLTLNLTSIG